MQSKKNSFIEALVNTFIGFIITLGCSFFIYPLCGVKASIGSMSGVTFCFTIISIIRQYVIRRFFNKKETSTETVKRKQQWKKLISYLPILKQLSKNA